MHLHKKAQTWKLFKPVFTNKDKRLQYKTARL